MIDLQDDEKIIVQVRKSKAILVPQAALALLAGAAALLLSLGFYEFRDGLMFGKDGMFAGPQGWLQYPIHQTIVIFGGLIFLLVAAFVVIKVVQRKSAAKREAEGKPAKQPKKERHESAEHALVRKSRQRLTSYYNVEKYMMLAVVILSIAMGLFGFERVSPWFYAVFTAVPLGLYLYIRWHMTRYVLTTRRLIINAGLISNFFWDLPFDKYDEISGEQNFVERILRFGDLTVNSVGGSREVILNVPNPQVMRKNFHAVREEYKKHLMEGAGGGHEPEEAPGKPAPEAQNPAADDPLRDDKPPGDLNF